MTLEYDTEEENLYIRYIYIYTYIPYIYILIVKTEMILHLQQLAVSCPPLLPRLVCTVQTTALHTNFIHQYSALQERHFFNDSRIAACGASHITSYNLSIVCWTWFYCGVTARPLHKPGAESGSRVDRHHAVEPRSVWGDLRLYPLGPDLALERLQWMCLRGGRGRVGVESGARSFAAAHMISMTH